MTLADICEPIFQYVCQLNRLSRRGGRQDFGVVRAEFKTLLAQAKQKAESMPGMIAAWPTSELVLTFFFDSMILNCRLGQQGGWRPLSHDIGKLGFEEEFWDILDDVLRDPSDAATQTLSVFYMCIGLGFTGLNTNRPDVIKRKMLEISARLRGMIDVDQVARICPEAYENVDTRDLTPPVARSLTGLTLFAVMLLTVVLVTYFLSFKNAGNALNSSLTSINDKWATDTGAKAPKPAPDKAPAPAPADPATPAKSK
jgi:type VI protein secretion system component VasF